MSDSPPVTQLKTWANDENCLSRFASQTELVFIVLIWGTCITANLFFGSALNYSATPKGILFCLTGLILFLAPIILARSKISAISQAPFTSLNATAKVSFLNSCSVPILAIIALASLIVDYAYREVLFSSTDISQAREIYMEEAYDAVGSKPIFYITRLLSGLHAIPAIALVTIKLSRISRLLTILILALTFYVDAVSSGSRLIFRFVAAVSLAAVLVHYQLFLKRRWKLILPLALLGFFMLLLTLVTFNLFRSSQKNSAVFRQQIINETMPVLERVGLENANFGVVYTVRTTIGYLIIPISYFSYFLETYNDPPLYGTFSFRMLMNRFRPFFPEDTPFANDFKREVDLRYADIGVSGNIWATGFRELIFDTGIHGFFPMLFILGLLAVILRQYYAEYLSCRLLYILLIAWWLYSPFESLTKMNTESTLYFCIVCLCFEINFKRHRVMNV